MHEIEISNSALHSEILLYNTILLLDDMNLFLLLAFVWTVESLLFYSQFLAILRIVESTSGRYRSTIVLQP